MAYDAIRKSHHLFPVNDCHNLALRVAKLNQNIDDWNEKEHVAKDKALEFMESFQFPSDSATAYKKSFERWKNAIQSRGDSEIFEIQASTRVLLGTGNASVFEFGFNLNYPWGVPYISGSSLKGLVSSYLSRHGGKEWRRENGTAVKSDAQVELFGGVREKEYKDKNAYVGALIFHDAWLAAWPSKEKKNSGDWFDADIITPHHSSYYGGKGLPDGTESPIPIKMAALRPGLTFLVCIQGPEEYRAFVRKILLEALQEEGIGGKTAVGYGRFAYVQSDEEKNLRIRNDIEKSSSPTELQELFNSHKNNKSLTSDFKQALERIGFSNETKALFETFRPLALLCEQVEQGEIKDLKTLNDRFKNLKNQINKTLESESSDALKKTDDGRKLFNIMMSKWAEQLKAGFDLAVVKNLAYGWEELAFSEDELMNKVKKTGWIWPPLKDLPDYLANHPEKFNEETREIILMELDLI